VPTTGFIDVSRGTARERLSRARLGLARSVLRRRRLLAAVLVGGAVLSGLRATQPPPEDLVVIHVAARDLPGGTALAAEDVRPVGFRDGTVPAGVVHDVTGRVLAGPVRAGEPITEVRLVGAGLAQTYPDRVATPVRLPDAAAAALLRVGDRVDLWAADPQGGPARLVATDAPVLAVPDAVADESLPGRLVVLGLEPSEAGEHAARAVTHFLTLNWSR
jgi:Flp pilus assembly protein CpaB